jgi:hypothetical protein
LASETIMGFEGSGSAAAGAVAAAAATTRITVLPSIWLMASWGSEAADH